MSTETNAIPSTPDDESRRDFLILTTGTMVVAGTAIAAWPFIDSMNPSVDVLAISSTEIDLSPIKVGQRITIVWRGKPVFVDHRSPEQIKMAQTDDTATLIDPQLDSQRVQKDEWLIVIGICTHLGCIPLGQKASDPRGDWGGWFCPCHGSQYDTSGRVRKGPAPRNLDIPAYRFIEGGKVRIG